MHINSTFSLFIGVHPVLVAGFTDLDQKFIPVAIGITKNNDHKSYLWLFQNLNNDLETIGFIWAVKNITFNLAEAITKAN
ncbi:hypothetical protein AYI68_g5203 [Smittium mucronatum]|uniref:MULE transposase domain-containing protein n=1 Tax=Smittium mucronatum TaxID=133383 RepID=A0A1R0GUN5_9FUNG|nr:hypothetical protein AYI68_g5321 [Smittium mucronatum]OLY80696.1 hypothetical protein AYI68_g5203 [Smittium mucronatum]